MDHNELVDKITQAVVKRLEEAKAGSGAGSTGGSTGVAKEKSVTPDNLILPGELAKYIDHTLLKPEATREQIDQLIDEAIEHNFYSVCVNSAWTEYCAKRLQGTQVKLAVVVGFPLGAMNARAKGFETRHAVELGAHEIDMVMNVGELRSGHLKAVEDDMRAVRRATRQKTVLKVILETSLLSDEQKVVACQIAKKANADFVKTSTGFSKGGATVHDIALMRRTVGPKMGVKASGGVRSYEDAVAMIQAGATRLGTSSGISIVQGGGGSSSY